MARFALCFAVVLAVLAADLRAQDQNAIGEIVRSGAAVESSPAPVGQPSSVAERELDFRFGQDDDLETNSSKTHYDTNIRPAGNEELVPAGTGEPDTDQPRRLAPRQGGGKASAAKTSLSNPTESLITMGGSLCVVLTLFFGLAWITRRGMPKNNGKLPGEVIEVLGKTPLVKGQELQLVRVGAKLLLICVTPTGCETLTEIVDRGEVDRLSMICRSNGPASMTAAFNQVLTGIGREPATGFAGSARTIDRRGGRAHA